MKKIKPARFPMGATNTSNIRKLAVSVSLFTAILITGCALSPVNPWAILSGDIETPEGFPDPVDAQKPSLSGIYQECASGEKKTGIYWMLRVKQPKTTGPKFRINHNVATGDFSITPLLDFDKEGKAVGVDNYEPQGSWWRRRLTFRVPKTYAYLSLDRDGNLIGYNEESRYHFVCEKVINDT